jgi:hypothetical protein
VTIVFAVMAGIVLSLFIAALVAALATAVLGAALAAICLPYRAVKARLNKPRAVPATEPAPVPATEAAPVLAQALPAAPQPVASGRAGMGWLRPVAAALVWSVMTSLVDTALRD